MTNIAAYLASRKLTIERAAAKAGLSRDRFEQVAGGAGATLGEIRKIAKALGVPFSSLMDKAPAEPIRMLFRQTLDQREVEVGSQVDVVAAQVRDALVIARELPSDLTWLDLFHGLKPRVETAEDFAQKFRSSIAKLDDLEPFPQLPEVISELGIFILFSRDPSVEGVSAIVESHALVILGPRSFKPRMLFTIAHELGHLVAHHDSRVSGYAHLDREVSGLREPQRDEEKFADAFAAALLLPRPGILTALKAIRDLLRIEKGPLGAIEIAWIAHFFHVSFEVAARRFEVLGLLPSNSARAFYQKLEDDYGNPERFAAAIDIPPRPDLLISPSQALVDAAVEKVRSGSMSIGKAAELLNIPVSTLVVANADISV